MGIFAFIVVALTFTANLVIALVVYRNNPKSWTNRFTAGLAIIFALWTIFNYFALLPGSETTRIFWVRLVMLVTTPMGAFTYLLAKGFPTDKLAVSNKTIYFFLTLIVIVGIFALSPWMFSRVENLPNDSFNLIPGPAILLFAISHLGLTSWGVIILINKFRHAQGLLKKQLLFFLTGTVLTLTLITLTNFVAVVFFQAMQYTFIGPTFTLFQVGFITYAVVKHRLFDIRLVVARTVAYSLLLLFLAGITFSSIIFTAQFFTEGSSPITIYTILTLLIAFTFNPLKQTFESITNNFFYKQSYSSEKLLEKIGEILRSTIALDSLTKKTLTLFTDTMHITYGAYYLTQKDKDKYRIYTSGNDRRELTTGEIETLTRAANNKLLIFEDLEETPIKMLLRDAQISVCLPLKVKQELHGLLILSDKSSGEIYNQQDIDVLEIFMPQISVAIHNAKSVDEIRRFNVTLKEEVQAATTDLKSANRNLKHLDKLKDEFVFIATHELKNPVTAMRGYLSMLQEGMFGHIPEKMKGPIDQLQASNQQLVDLVNDLLQIARSEAKTLNITTEDVNLCPVIDTVIENVKPLADQKNITVKHLQPASKEIMVKTDPNRLKEIMNNLIGNAIKYSDSGTITINHAIDKEFVTTSVKDQGVGISQEDQKKLFTRFYRVEEEAAKGIPGTGLGLFIVKQLIEKMHGKIWLESTKGQGTTFSFTLPRAN
jgi:signal transduction histidine kinase